MPSGRLTEHTPEIAKAICEQLADGLTLREVCRQEGMPPESTVRRWVLDDRNGFAAQYAEARQLGYQAMADELLEIADDGRNDWIERRGEVMVNGEHVQRSRLRLDTRKWLLSKALPKVYGDKVIHAGDENAPVMIQEIKRVIVDPKKDA